MRTTTWQIIGALGAMIATALIAATDARTVEPSGDPIAAQIERDMHMLASPGLEGRGVATRGGARAEAIVAQRFADIGLEAAVRGRWFQTVPLVRFETNSSRSFLEVTRGTERRRFAYGRSFFFASPPRRPGRLLAPIVQLTSLDASAPDQAFVGVATQGALVVFPRETQGASTVWARAWLSWRKPFLAREHGAAGVLTAVAPNTTEAQWTELAQAYDLAGLTRWRLNDSSSDTGANVVIGPDVSAWLNQQTEVGGAPPIAAQLLVAGVRRRATARNVIGVLRGRDPVLATEVVVVTAHLDHLGRQGAQIYPGAVDNAAGVATMIAVAERLVRAGERPRRTIAFVATAGEEAGDLGSHYFVRHFPSAGMRIVANINIDGGSMWPFDSIVARGGELTSLDEFARAACARSRCSLAPDPLGERAPLDGSDQFAFLVAGIPAMQITVARSGDSRTQALSWFRERYHQPSDDMQQPLDFDAAASFSRAVAAIVLEAANSDEAPHWSAEALAIVRPEH